MAQIKIGIVGLGQMGGSLGLALKKHSGNKYYIIGVARREETLKAALKIGAADKVSLSLQDTKSCDIVVICTPVDTVASIYKELAKIVEKSTIITDVGSVKEEIERQIEEWRVKSEDNNSGLLRQGDAFPRNDDAAVCCHCEEGRSPDAAIQKSVAVNSALPFVFVHPMAGKENNGILSADAQMFKNANVVITGSIKKSLKNPAKVAEAKIAEMWKYTGANIIKMSAKKHDELVALTSHLPHLIAFSLNKIYKDKKKKNQIIEKIAAGSFKSATRVANSSADMWAPIFAANKGNIKKHLKAFIKELHIFEKSLNNQAKLKKAILKTQI